MNSVFPSSTPSGGQLSELIPRHQRCRGVRFAASIAVVISAVGFAGVLLHLSRYSDTWPGAILLSAASLVCAVLVAGTLLLRIRSERAREELLLDRSAMAEAIPQIVWTAQADGTVDFYNQRWFEFTGLTAAESEGLDWTRVIHREDAACCIEKWNAALHSGSELEVEARFKQRDGVWHWHLIRALPVLDRAGRTSKWFGTFTDIDDQKRVEESMRFLANASSILSASMDERETLQRVAELAVPKIADLCTVHLVSEASPELLLAAVSHMDPRKVELVIELDRHFPPFPERTDLIVNVIRSGKALRLVTVEDPSLETVSSDGVHRTLMSEVGVRSAMVLPLRGLRAVIGVVTFMSTDSSRRYTARDLALAEEVTRSTALALDNNRLFAQLLRTKEEAEAANVAKDQFLAVLSHELRTPLTPVLLSLETLEHATQHSHPPAMREMLSMIRRNIELEAILIDDLLDLTRIQRGKLQLRRRPTDVHAVLRHAVEICRADITGKNLHLSFDLSATHSYVHADPARLQQVFWNLIKNAVKFTDHCGCIVFRSRNPVEGSIQIEVEDSGIGIDASVLPKIFDAFEQGEKSRTRRFGGLGLGLAITKNLVEAHGGVISATSPGRDLGSRFLVELGTVDSPAEEEQDHSPAPPPPIGWPGLHILLVEDDKDTGVLLQKILDRRGYEVELATSMRCALSLAEQTTFDLLISDVGLPDGSGHELMRRLLETRPIPGIAMSGFGMDDDLRQSREAGFAEHLVKPINVANLEEAIRKLSS